MPDAHAVPSVFFRRGQILPRSDLVVCVIALCQPHRQARQLKGRTVVRHCVTAHLRQHLPVQRGAKTLRRLHGVQLFPRGRFHHEAVRRHLYGVLHRDGRRSCPCFIRGLQGIPYHLRRDERARRVVDGHIFRIHRIQARTHALHARGTSSYGLCGLGTGRGQQRCLRSVFSRHQ